MQHPATGHVEPTRDAHPIVLFDGVCGLCDGFVTWLIRRDRNATFRVAALQGETGMQYASAEDPSDPERWSVILVEAGQVFHRSEAILRIVSRLGGVYRLAAVFRLVPLFIRDGIYRVVARHRYRWFGKRQVCRVPTPEERSRFLP
jgi:predicted DCC family thiol-disulfide oxidoreductase YuxK